MDIIDKMLKFRPLDLPVGSAVMLAVAMGLADGFGDVITLVTGAYAPAFVAPFVGLIGNVGVALMVEKIGAVNRFLGDDLADLIGVAAMVSGVDNLTNAFGLPGISGGISSSIAKVAGFLPLPGARTVAAPVAVAPTEAATSGYSLGQPAAEVGATIDDVDMTFLAARGYNL